MMRAIGALLALVLSVCCAQAQSSQFVIPSYSGTTTALSPTGYSGANGTLYAVSASSLHFGLPFSISYDIKSTGLSGLAQLVIDTRNGVSTAGVGFATGNCPGCNTSSLQFGTFVNGSSFGGFTAGQTFARTAAVNDGGWHNVCTLVTATGTSLYLDAYLVDFNGTALTFTPQTGYWVVGNTPGTPAQFRDIRAYTVNIGQGGCETLSNFNAQGLTPSSGPLQSNLVMQVPMNNCNSIGCADNSGAGNNLLYDTSIPSCAITGAAAPGFSNLVGSQTLTATCTDNVGISSVQWYVDGVWVGSSSTAPYTTTWNTAIYVDATHTVTAQSLNVAGLVGTNSSTGTTLNGVSAKTVYLDPTSGTDCPTNNGLSTGAPCSTLAGVMAVITSNNLHGGDSILLQHATNLNITDMTNASVLNIAGTTCATGEDPCNGVAQNTNPGLPITISTYGGSGNCHVQAGVTSDCASITFSVNGVVTNANGVFNIMNTQNILVENLRFFGSQSNAIACGSGCGYGIKLASGNNWHNWALAGSYATIENVETTDFATGIWINAAPNGSYPSFGDHCGISIQDNYLHGSSVSSQTQTGIYVASLFCIGSVPQLTSIQVLSNVANDIGGQLAPGQDGTGIVLLNDINGFVDNFNVTGNTGYNNTTCGGPYGNWTFESNGGIFKGDESYNIFPHGNGLTANCDKGAFDLDNGTENIVIEYSFGHETFGPAVNVLFQPVANYVSGNNTVSYNIFENNNALVTSQNGGSIDVGAAVGFFNVYNNTFWNGYPGQTISPVPSATQTAPLALGNCFSTTQASYIANNISVSNSVAGVVSAQFYYGGFALNCPSYQYPKFVTNDWFGIGTGATNLLWKSVAPGSGFGTSYTTLAGWNAAAPANDINSLPGFSGVPPFNAACNVLLTAAPPVQPGTIPCPTAYEITHAAATENTGTDLSQAPYSLYVTTQDFYTNTVPYTGHGGPGTNMGADGAFR